MHDFVKHGIADRPMHLSKADRNSKASQKETKPKGLLQLPHKYPR